MAAIERHLKQYLSKLGVPVGNVPAKCVIRIGRNVVYEDNTLALAVHNEKLFPEKK